MKAALRWIASSVPLIALALILAVLAWVVAAEEADPTITERYAPSIPITPLGLSEEMVIVGGLNQRVQVTVRAPESVWRAITADDFSATVDLTGMEPGTHEVPVRVELSRGPSRLMYEPESLTLELERSAERVVPVRVEPGGDPALGYIVQAAAATPGWVTVSGPSSYVNQVVHAVGQIFVGDASAVVEGELTLRPVDDEGRPVPYVALTPEVVHVRVPVELSEEYATLTVRPTRIGRVASGYRMTDITADPSTVNVRGAPDVLAALPGYIDTEPINVEGAQTNVVVQPALDVPPNVTLVSGQQVTVTVSIEPIQSSLTLEISPTLQGLAPGLTATVSPVDVEVFLSGPQPTLESLKAGDVRVILDLFDLARGTHQVELQGVVPEGVTLQSILPATVQVEISTAPTPTPTPRPTRTPRPVPSPTPVQG